MEVLTAERLRELLDYNPATGVFTWKRKTGSKSAGSLAGTPHNGRYINIQVAGKQYRAHRLAWLWMTGSWPHAEVDHRIGLSNAWENLRLVTRHANMQNQRRAHKRNSCGFLGVTKQGMKYRPRLWVNGRNMSLGLFDTPEQAHAAYLSAKRTNHEGNTL